MSLRIELRPRLPVCYQFTQIYRWSQCVENTCHIILKFAAGSSALVGSPHVLRFQESKSTISFSIFFSAEILKSCFVGPSLLEPFSASLYL